MSHFNVNNVVLRLFVFTLVILIQINISLKDLAENLDTTEEQLQKLGVKPLTITEDFDYEKEIQNIRNLIDAGTLDDQPNQSATTSTTQQQQQAQQPPQHATPQKANRELTQQEQDSLKDLKIPKQEINYQYITTNGQINYGLTADELLFMDDRLFAKLILPGNKVNLPLYKRLRDDKIIEGKSFQKELENVQAFDGDLYKLVMQGVKRTHNHGSKKLGKGKKSDVHTTPNVKGGKDNGNNKQNSNGNKKKQSR